MGKVTLIKSTILSLPIYLLAGCKVPYSLFDKIEKLIRNLLWNDDNGPRHFHLISWNTITKPRIRHLGSLQAKGYLQSSNV